MTKYTLVENAPKLDGSNDNIQMVQDESGQRWVRKGARRDADRNLELDFISSGVYVGNLAHKIFGEKSPTPRVRFADNEVEKAEDATTVSEMLEEDGEELTDFFDLTSKGEYRKRKLEFTAKAKQGFVDSLLFRVLMGGQDARENNVIARIGADNKIDLSYQIDFEYSLNDKEHSIPRKTFSGLTVKQQAYIASKLSERSGVYTREIKKKVPGGYVSRGFYVGSGDVNKFLKASFKRPQEFLENFVFDRWCLNNRDYFDKGSIQAFNSNGESLFSMYKTMGFDFDNVEFPDGQKLDGFYILQKMREIIAKVEELKGQNADDVFTNIDETNYSAETKQALKGKVAEKGKLLDDRLAGFKEFLKEFEFVKSQDDLEKFFALTEVLREASVKQSRMPFGSFASRVQGRLSHNTALYKAVEECLRAKNNDGENLFDPKDIQKIALEANPKVKFQSKEAVKYWESELAKEASVERGASLAVV